MQAAHNLDGAGRIPDMIRSGAVFGAERINADWLTALSRLGAGDFVWHWAFYQKDAPVTLLRSAGPALVRGFMVAAFAIAGQEIVGKVKDAAGGGAGSSNGQLPPKDGGMWTGAGDGGSTHRAALALAMSLALALSGCGRLTPAQTATLGSAVPKIAGAGCEIVQSFTDASWVKFLCRVVEGGGISNMSTGAPGVDARPRVVEVEVLVPKEQADAFAAANHASQ
jgi:hypothetical protein